MELQGIGQIHITVTDLDRSIEFYRDVLEADFLFRVPEQPMAFFDCNGVRLYLGEAESPEFRSNPLIYYRVPAIEAAHQELTERGVTFSDEPHVVHRTEDMELWMAFLRDPDGNYLALMEERNL